MFEKILVAYNASKRSTIALRQAAEIARLSGGELYLLGIVPISGGLALAGSAGPMDMLGLEHKRIQDALYSVAQELGGEGMKVTASIREGDPANEIIACAHHIGADLAVVGHSDKGALARWFQGSVGAKLLSDLPCSLLIATKR